jgi:hypothetical protein
MEAAMKAFGRVLTFGILLLLSFRADAHDPSMPHHEWFNKQEMTPAARQRLGVPWKSAATTAMYSRPALGLVKIAQTSGNT